MNITGGILKKLRVNKNMTLEELVKEVNEKFNTNITISMITKWENGKLEAEYSQLKCLALYYNVTTDFLLGFDLDEFVDIIDLRDDLEINKMLDELKGKLNIPTLKDLVYKEQYKYNIIKLIIGEQISQSKKNSKLMKGCL